MKPPASWFPYGQPDDLAALALCDPLIVGLVKAVNGAHGAVRGQGPWTVQSCEGHPWPMLELVGTPFDLKDVASEMLNALGEKQQLVIAVIVAPSPWIVPGEGSAHATTVQLARWRFEVPALTLMARQAGRAVLGAPWGWVE